MAPVLAVSHALCILPQMKSCVEEKAAPKVVDSPKGLEWKALNNQTFGYT